jgi:Domain of unknown function (DUF1937)
MRLADLKKFDLIYIGTPYSKYPGGIEVAFIDACRLTAQLLSEGLNVYSPIAHTHPISVHGGIDPMDLSIWLPFDAAMMGKADAMIVAMMAGWESSTGVRHEIQAFIEVGKPVYFLDLTDLGVEVATTEEREQFRSERSAA